MSESGIEQLLTHLGSHAQSVEVINPATGKPSFLLPQFSAEETKAVVAAARAVAPDWAKVPVRERARVLLDLHDLMIVHQQELLELLQFETGKARGHAFEDFAGALNSAVFYGKIAARRLKPKRVPGMAPVLLRNTVEYVPIGVVGVITPWNYPLALTGLDVFPALAAGNAVVQKIDNQTALSALYLRDLAVRAGLPETAWTIVAGDGPEVGNAITDSVDYVAFTGSTATGRIVAQRAAARLIGFSLELGGKNPMIVLPGANLRKAAGLALAAGSGNSGQLCVSIERVYVPAEVEVEFVAELRRKLGELKVGRGADYGIDMGSLTTAAQLDRFQSALRQAAGAGATVLGGELQPAAGPYAVKPAILTGVTEAAKLHRSEVFGPVLQVYGYSSVDEAVSLANDTEYGLNASVVGPSRLAREVGARLNAGSININEGFRASFGSMSSPMGGFKQSGSGRRNGDQGLYRFVEARAVGEIRFYHLPIRGQEYALLSKLYVLRSRIRRLWPF